MSCETGTSRRPGVDAIDADLEEAGLGWTLAAFLVACAAAVLALLPVAVAVQGPSVPGGLAGAVGTLAVVVAVVKVAAMAWGVASRVLGLHRVSVAAAYAD